VFTVDGFYAAALNQDGTVNSASNAALAGTIVSVFATGLGLTNPVETDGAIVAPPIPGIVGRHRFQLHSAQNSVGRAGALPGGRRQPSQFRCSGHAAAAAE
jgi:uncharacterized protein (TIGR03437 family)